MNPVLKGLGISAEVQAFFHADDLCFDYGGVSEIYEEGLHFVPTTTGIWLAGNRYGTEVIITHSAMEAIAWFAVNHRRYADPAALALISLGNLPSREQLSWVQRSFPRRKFTLVFGNCLLGKLADIRVAVMLKGKSISMSWQKKKAVVCFQGCTACFEESQCSLHRFENQFGVRSGIRTSKPALHVTYLTQLQHDSRIYYIPARD